VKVADLEKEVSDLKATVKAFEDHSKADKEEIDRLHKEILESDAEGLRAKIEVLKHENELLIGNVAPPNKTYFG
jgi:chaperonin cofactor prefoldin